MKSDQPTTGVWQGRGQPYQRYGGGIPFTDGGMAFTGYTLLNMPVYMRNWFGNSQYARIYRKLAKQEPNSGYNTMALSLAKYFGIEV